MNQWVLVTIPTPSSIVFDNKIRLVVKKKKGHRVKKMGWLMKRIGIEGEHDKNKLSEIPKEMVKTLLKDR